MRIISKFRDYYDIGLSYGVDTTIVYERKQETIHTPAHIFLQENEYLRNQLGYSRQFRRGIKITPLILGYCGTLYCMYIVKLPKKGKTWNFGTEEHFVYDNDTLHTLLEGYEYAESWIDENWVTQIKNDSLFLKYNTPILQIDVKDVSRSWISDKNTFSIITNPTLKDFQFQKIADPFTAFQDISMYLTNQLAVNEPDTVKITEPEIIQKKGFDLKYGFRKRPKT